MNDAAIIEFAGRETVSDPLTELLRNGARQLLQSAIEAELEAFLAKFADHRTAEGRAAVVPNGHRPERAVQTGIGPVTVKVPKVRSKSGKPVTFRSALVPPYVRKAKSIEAALPWLYLKGISTGEMGAALKMLLGPEATGFSAKTISHLKGQWTTSDRLRRAHGQVAFTSAQVTEFVRESVRIRSRLGFRRQRGHLAVTIQRAKNREFPNVIVLWPHTATGSSEHLRRLLYNAITRAKNHCTVIVLGQGRMNSPPFAPTPA